MSTSILLEFPSVKNNNICLDYGLDQELQEWGRALRWDDRSCCPSVRGLEKEADRWVSVLGGTNLPFPQLGCKGGWMGGGQHWGDDRSCCPGSMGL